MLNIINHAENRQTTVSFSFSWPEVKKADCDLHEARRRQQARVYDVVGAFSQFLIESIERRMKACESNLLRHLPDVEYCDKYGHIEWKGGGFNKPSYETMQNAVKALQHSQWGTFLNSRAMLDQTIKALLNDDELKNRHEKQGGFKFSELVSILGTQLEAKFVDA